MLLSGHPGAVAGLPGEQSAGTLNYVVWALTMIRPPSSSCASGEPLTRTSRSIALGLAIGLLAGTAVAVSRRASARLLV